MWDYYLKLDDDLSGDIGVAYSSLLDAQSAKSIASKQLPY